MLLIKVVILVWYSCKKIIFRKIKLIFDLENWLWKLKFGKLYGFCSEHIGQKSKIHLTTSYCMPKISILRQESWWNILGKGTLRGKISTKITWSIGEWMNWYIDHITLWNYYISMSINTSMHHIINFRITHSLFRMNNTF